MAVQESITSLITRALFGGLFVFFCQSVFAEKAAEDELPTIPVESSERFFDGFQLDGEGVSPFFDRANLLEKAPGLQIVSLGGPAQATTISLRGGRSQDSLVLLDGFLLNDPLAPAGSADLSEITNHQIKSLQVFLGPQSVRFGSGATGGVVLIESNQSRARSSLLLEGGIPNSQRLEAQIPTSFSTARLFTSFGFQRHLGSSVAASGDPATDNRLEKDQSTVGSMSFLFIPERGTESGWRLGGRWLEKNLELDNFGGAAGDDPDNRSLSQLGSLHVSFTSQPEGLAAFTPKEIRFHLGGQLGRRRDENPASAISSDASFGNFSSFRSQGRIETDWRLSELTLLTVGIEHRHEEGQSQSLSNGIESHFERRDMNAADLYSIVQFEVEKDSLSFGARGSQSSARQLALAQEVAWQRAISEGLRTQLRYATGFKYPTLFQLHSAYGDPDLQTEKVSQISWTTEVRGETWLSQVNLFSQKFSQLIDYDLTKQKYQNIQGLSAQGIEISIKNILNERLSLEWGGQSLRAREEGSGRAPSRKPELSAFAELQREGEFANLSVAGRWVGPREDQSPSGPERTKLGDYFIVDLSVVRSLTPAVKASLRAQNLLNRQYQNIVGYSSPGREIFLGVEGNF